MPTYFGIREPGKRAVEFVLALDTQQAALKRQVLERRAGQIKEEWLAARDGFDGRAKQDGVLMQGIPRSPTSDWPPAVAPRLMVTVDGEWVPVEPEIRADRVRLRELMGIAIPKVVDAADEMNTRLAAAEEELRRTGASASEHLQELELARSELEAANNRVAALEEDLHRNQDAETLHRLGSEGSLGLLGEECPTCHQKLTDVILSKAQLANPMTIQDNIAFIKEQIRTFQVMSQDSARVVEVRERSMSALNARAFELRQEIRIIKLTLTSAESDQSAAAIAAQIRMGDRIEKFEQLSVSFVGLLEHLALLSSDWRSVQGQLEGLRGEQTSDLDRLKLRQLGESVRSQLAQYDFKSFPVSELDISEAKYTPSREGFDLGFDLSASDMIRTIWAYLLGLLEIARTNSTNHPGVLILDEPRQQETDPVSFGQFLQRASRASAANQQVVFATSEQPVELQAALDLVPHSYIAFTGKLIAPT
jgi:hypothetical protein